MKMIPVILIFSFVFTSCVLELDDYQVEIINMTPKQYNEYITGVYVSPYTGTGNIWGENRISRPIGPGEGWIIYLPGNTYDFKFVLSSSRVVYIRENVSGNRTIRVY